MNVLILSCGTRNKIVQYFKNAFAGVGRIVAADMSPYALALYEADAYYVVPPITDGAYLNAVLDICRKEQIAGILSLIDPELSVLAEYQKQFAKIGVTVIGSDLERCNRALDKRNMYLWMAEHHVRCARSYTSRSSFYADLDVGRITFPVYIKPICGSGSIATNVAYDRETVDFYFSHGKDMLIQECLKGQEIGADVYADLITGEVVSIFAKKKLLMRAGETDKAVSFRDEELFRLIECFVTENGFRGPVDIDIFESDGEYFISEVNPRFGGGYPHAYECGVDHMAMIRNNLNGAANKSVIGAYEEGVLMMKYSEIAVKKR